MASAPAAASNGMNRPEGTSGKRHEPSVAAKAARTRRNHADAIQWSICREFRFRLSALKRRALTGRRVPWVYQPRWHPG